MKTQCAARGCKNLSLYKHHLCPEHADHWGPYDPEDRSGAKYLALFTQWLEEKERDQWRN